MMNNFNLSLSEQTDKIVKKKKKKKKTRKERRPKDLINKVASVDVYSSIYWWWKIKLFLKLPQKIPKTDCKES